MLMKDDTSSHKISEKDQRTADVLWKILLLTRLVIPVYVIYAIYLYWTMQPSAYLLNGN